MKIKYSAVDTEKERITMLLQMFKNGLAGTMTYRKDEALKLQEELYRLGYQWYDKKDGSNFVSCSNEEKGTSHYLVKHKHKDGSVSPSGMVLCCVPPYKNTNMKILFNAKILIDNIVEFENLS